VAASGYAAPDLRSMVAPIHDYTSTVTATFVDTDELSKIRRDYAQSYKVRTSRITYLAPEHFKVDGSLGPIPIIYIINGNMKDTKYGPLHRKKDITNDPGQKQSLLDFGLLTADHLENYNWKYVRSEKVGDAT